LDYTLELVGDPRKIYDATGGLCGAVVPWIIYLPLWDLVTANVLDDIYFGLAGWGLFQYQRSFI